jgi:hypothetical protein
MTERLEAGVGVRELVADTFGGVLVTDGCDEAPPGGKALDAASRRLSKETLSERREAAE